MELQRTLLVTALLCTGVACGGQPEETLRGRHRDQGYRGLYQPSDDGLALSGGPDGSPVARLLDQPRSGLAPDTLEKDLLWLYTSDQERDEVSRTLRQRRLHRTVAAAPSPDGVQASCAAAVLRLFTGSDYGGVNWDREGEFYDPDLRGTGWNDELSSLSFLGDEVILYENPDGKGHSLALFSQIDADPIPVTTADGGESLCTQGIGQYPSLRKYLMSWRI